MMLWKMFLPYGCQPSAKAGLMSAFTSLSGWVGCRSRRFPLLPDSGRLCPLGRAMGFSPPRTNRGHGHECRSRHCV